MKTISIKDFVEEGYLQELNRQFLHPLGLALSIQIDDDGKYNLSDIIDNRDDPEGIIFDESLAKSDGFVAKANKIMNEQEEKARVREGILGTTIQLVKLLEKK